LAASEGVVIPIGKELFAHAYLHYLGWEDAAASFVKMPEDIIQGVNKFAAASKTGKDNLPTLMKPIRIEKAVMHPEGVVETRGFKFVHEASMLSAQRVNAPPIQTDTPAFKKWFGNAWFRDPDGTPKLLYHQTDRANVSPIKKKGFDLSKGEARIGDERVPDGIFMKPDKTDIRVGATGDEAAQIPLYTSIRNPLVVETAEHLKGMIADEVPEYNELDIKRKDIDKKYGKEIDDLDPSHFPKHLKRGTPEWDDYFEEYKAKTDEIFTVWTLSYNAIASQMRELLTDHLKSKGYDGVWIKKDVGSFGRATETMVAFEPTQVKSAVDNVGTFDPNIPGIMFSVEKQGFREGQERPRLDKYIRKVEEDFPKMMDPLRAHRLKELENNKKNLTPDEKVELKNLRNEKKGFAALDPFLRRKLSTDIKRRIKTITTGYNMGAQERQKHLQDLKFDINRYARLFLPRGTFMKSEVTRLISATAKARNPQTVGEAFDKIRQIENKVRRRTVLAAFNKLIRKADPEKGDPQFVTWIKQIRRMSAVEVQAEMDRVLNETAPKGMDLSEAQDEYFYLLNKYSDIKNKPTDELEELYLELAAEMEAGRTKRKQWLADEKERKAELRTKSLDVITGGKGVLDVDEARAAGLLKEARTAGDMLSNLGTMSHSWEMIMDKLSKRDPSEPLRSFLNQKWAVDVHKARNQEGEGVRTAMDKVRSKLMEIYDASKRSIVNEMNENSVRQPTGAKRWKITERDEAGLPTERIEIPLNLSQNEAAHILMAYEDPQLSKTFEKWGFDEKTIEDLRSFVKPKVMQWARWQVEKFYPEYYAGVNDVYKQIRGVNLPFNSKYIPIQREVSANITDAEFLGDVTEFVSMINGSLLPRIANTRPLKIMDIDRVLLNHIITMEHFKAFAPIMADMRAVFNSEPVRAAIKQYHGTTMLKVVNRFINDFARGGVDRKNSIEIIDKIRSNFIRSVIGVNPVVTIKQLTSFPAFAMDIPVKDFMVGITQFAGNPIPKIKFLMKNSEMLKTRYHKGWERDIILAMQRARKTTAKELTRKFTFTDAAMMFTKFGDGAAILFGGWSVYNYWNKKMLKAGKTREQAHEKAMLEFEMSAKRAQQAGDVEDLGELQRQGSWQKLFTIFMTAPKQYFSNASAAYRNIFYKRGQFHKNMKRLAIAHFLLPMLFQFSADGFRWDKDHMLRAALLGSLNGILILGDIMEFLLSAFQGDLFWEFDETPVGSMVGDAKDAILKVKKVTDSNQYYLDEVLEAVDAIADATSKPIGLPYQPVKKLTKGIMDFSDAPDEESFLRLFGYPKRIFEDEPKLDPMVEEIKQDEKRLKKLKAKAREMPKIQEYIDEAKEFEQQLKLKKQNSPEWLKYQQEQKLERKEKKKNDPFRKPTKPKTGLGKQLFNPKLKIN
jgi:hypothetical protein